MTQQEFGVVRQAPYLVPDHMALKRAWELLEAAGEREPPTDVEKLARYLGVTRIKYEQFLRADACLVPNTNGQVVIINASSGKRRQRFSLAHEIGHLLLGRGGMRFRNGRDPHSEEERLANIIAAELLIPTRALLRIASDLQPSLEAVKSLSDKFHAALEPTAIKLGELKKPYGASVAYWQDCHGILRRKWSVGKLPESMMEERSVRDTAFGPCAALRYEEQAISYESSLGGNLDMVCESEAFGKGYRRFVLSIARPDTGPHQEGPKT